jgi:hypothetical protein
MATLARRPGRPFTHSGPKARLTITVDALVAFRFKTFVPPGRASQIIETLMARHAVLRGGAVPDWALEAIQELAARDLVVPGINAPARRCRRRLAPGGKQ